MPFFTDDICGRFKIFFHFITSLFIDGVVHDDMQSGAQRAKPVAPFFSARGAEPWAKTHSFETVACVEGAMVPVHEW